MASIMEVFLVRHAIAHERNRKRWPDDAQRPLTAAGARKFRKAAKGLAKLLPKSAALLTSPYVRARDTADILAATVRRSKAITCPQLATDAGAKQAFALLKTRKEQSVVLVGHEPYLSEFLSSAIGGDAAGLCVEFKKGGAACLEFGKRIAPGRAVLKWMLPPRVLRAVG
jgi:phosphohistidine phosphatase